MTRDLAYIFGARVAMAKRAVEEADSSGETSKVKKPDAKAPGADAPEDVFGDERQQFQRILGISPEEMQAQQQFQLAGLGRSMRARQLMSTLRQMFAPLSEGGA